VSNKDIQGAPKNNNPLGKINYSVTVIDFFTKFTAFTEEVSGHIGSKFCYNIYCGLKTSGSAMAEGPRDALLSRNSATYKTSHLKK